MASVELSETPLPRSMTEETGYLLRRAYVRAGEWAAAEFPAGVPIRHYEVLQALADLGPRSQHQLAALLWVNRTIMVKLIDALEADGLVERRRDPADRRSYALQLTAAGRDALGPLSAAADRAEAGLTRALSPEQRTTLHAYLTALAAVPDERAELPAGLAARISFLLTDSHQRVRERATQSMQPLGLTTGQYGALATIAAQGPVSQQEIADQLGLTGPAILQTVDRLEALGLVERRRNPADRRSYALEPTAHGSDVLGQVRGAVAEIHHDLDDVLGGERERHELNRLLRALL